ncbi:MAG: metal-dependent hydrolase [Verrucomicrobia bacterium]|nr:metal-dependent hydrolase [Verrucomicrobiota bacterium]
MKPIARRRFLKDSLLTGVALSLPNELLAAQTAPRGQPAASPAIGLIDTNVNLFDWPFRKLKYRDTRALVAKLRKHGVIEAWAGSFEALLHKDMDGVNTRLAGECRAHGGGMLVPFGSVNLAWPDWEEDVRRCHEVHRMPGIRLFPGYQAFDLDHAEMPRLVKMIAERNLILQVVYAMEDSRVYHPIFNVGRVTSAPLLEALKGVPNAKVELLHFTGSPRGEDLHQFMTQTNAVIDISRFEGNGAVGRLIGSGPGFSSGGAPGISHGRAPVERIVFGSHAPYYPLETALFKLIESPLKQSQLHAIMQGNARRLLPRA